ncbi:AraC family transcriptional regulator [Actinoallomurus rhizosphaericola]|uniref:AraC family transcriptional regulator n=1 Tax=Actinoallomurus rhizosphaericola TaxID=2952536 RepID=UPI002090E701|nr:AraC family transcriptional regulator [Actinoallomurus rhizosphaericola]MCO5994251.1 AraC family transcriptional regulator [Actinoallomurus rhizosphaericola]
MDIVAGLLNGPRAQGAFLLRSSLTPPWSLRVRDEAPLTLVATVRGTAWVIPESGGATELGPGDVAILRGPDPYTFADDPATAPQAVIHPGQRCTTPDGGELSDLGELGVRTWGNAAEGVTVLVTGTYQVLSEICRPLLDALPPLIVLRHDAWDGPLVPLLAAEVVKEEPGQDAVLDRLLDLLLVAALRTWFSRPEADPPRWYRAQSDPVVGAALRLLHDAPERPWTVAGLAAATKVSRAALARRFTALVGESPMAYLTAWRLALAADLLRDPGLSIGQVAGRVGYGSPFALSAAFKRVRGVSPREHRAAVARDQRPVAPTGPWCRPA